ncbi:MAG: hypothetical protein AAFZ52_09805 [Bacteroidota bacterium]
MTSIWLSACGQQETAKKPAEPKTGFSAKKSVLTTEDDAKLSKFVYADTTYYRSATEGIRIQNSFPKGGSIAPGGVQYVDAAGKQYGFGVFWTRISNQTTVPLDIDLRFPADSFAIYQDPTAYVKLLLPPAALDYDQLPAFNYGLTNVKSFLDASLHQGTQLQKTLAPSEEHAFYVAALVKHQAGGTVRTALILRGQDLAYTIRVKPQGGGIIPCGKLTLIE